MGTRSYIRCCQVYGVPRTPEEWDGCPGKIKPPKGYDVYSNNPTPNQRKAILPCPECGKRMNFDMPLQSRIPMWNDDFAERLESRAERKREEEREKEEARGHMREVLVRRGRL